MTLRVMSEIRTDPTTAKTVDALRAFNRFYTALLGALNERLLESAYSLTEARVLYELAQRGRATAAELARDLNIDPAYLSRIVAKFRKAGLVSASQSASDGRARSLALSEDGEAAFAVLDRASSDEVSALIAPLSAPERNTLARAAGTIRSLLGDDTDGREPYLIRSHRPGDLGWVIHRHAVLYAEEYGFDQSFETLVAQVAHDFLASHDPRREHCWMAERHGEPVGSVTVVDGGDGVAKLRLLYVEPSARGLGIGGRLVDECLHFARRAGYRRMTLWTNDILHAAQHIYQARGFELTAEEPHHSFGLDLVGQTWERDL